MFRIENRPRSPGGKVCAFTGHRPQKYPYLNDENSEKYINLKRRLTDEILKLIDEGYTHFMSGGALGVDLMAAGAVLELRQTRPELTLEIVRPCPDQATRWNAGDKRIYEDILARADIVTTACSEYIIGCMHKRDRFMAENCDTLLAVYDGSSGGTRTTIGYALDAEKNVTVLTP